MISDQPDLYLRIARESVVAAVEHRTYRAERQGVPQGVFVTIEVGGQIRGCRGTLRPQKASLLEEIAEAARSAAAFDPRYAPLKPKELAKLSLTVTLVDRLDPIESVAQITRDEGIVLTSGKRTGIVLPWEGNDSQLRLEWAYRKAGIATGRPVSLFRLVGRRYRG